MYFLLISQFILFFFASFEENFIKGGHKSYKLRGQWQCSRTLPSTQNALTLQKSALPLYSCLTDDLYIHFQGCSFRIAATEIEAIQWDCLGEAAELPKSLSPLTSQLLPGNANEVGPPREQGSASLVGLSFL